MVQKNADKNKQLSFSAKLAKVWVKSEFEGKDDFLDVIYWGRQILGIIIGVMWGILPLKGIFGLALFCAINAGLVYIYSINFQNIDEEAYGGIWEIIKEGFQSSFACFLVFWIVFYTGLHFDDLSMNKIV